MKILKFLIALFSISILMNDLLAQNTKVIAHRGAWKAKSLPQNSLASLNTAIALGCHGSEFDVHLTKDSVLVVNHDADFYGLVIAEATYRELLEKQHPNGERIPTAEAYLKEGMKQTNTKLVFELKTSSKGKERTLASAKKAVELVKYLNAQSYVEYICFDFDAGKLIKTLDPDAEVAYLNGDKTPEEAKAAGYTGLDYHYLVYQKHPTWIQEAKALGLTLNSWTVNSTAEMETLRRQEVDFITTDEPELLLQWLKDQAAH